MSRMIVECPRCGAVLPPEAADAATRCPHCETTSVPIARPAEPVRVVVEHVVRAGGAAAAARAMACPRCTGPLFEGKSTRGDLFGCGVCGGVWLDNDAASALAKNADPELVELAQRASEHAKVTPETAPAGLACPVCRQPLARVPAAVVEVDICEAHGTWFDSGELQRVASVFRKILAERARDQFEARMNNMVESIERARVLINQGQHVPYDPAIHDVVSAMIIQDAAARRRRP